MMTEIEQSELRAAVEAHFLDDIARQVREGVADGRVPPEMAERCVVLSMKAAQDAIAGTVARLAGRAH